MRYFIIVIILFCANLCICQAQNIEDTKNYDKHGVVWSAGIFKSWLTDSEVSFNKIGDQISPVFSEQKKIGFNIQSHYMYKPTKWFGIGAHIGIGLDIYSNTQAPVFLFGGSLSVGEKHPVIFNFGWADGKRKIVPNGLREELLEGNYSEIPELHVYTELNTHYYIGLSYRIH